MENKDRENNEKGLKSYLKTRRGKAALIWVTVCLAALIIGAILWGVLNANEFFICSLISIPLASVLPVLLGMMPKLLSSEKKEHKYALLSVLGRFLVVLVGLACCLLFLYFTSQRYLYLLVPPTFFTVGYVLSIYIQFER